MSLLFFSYENLLKRGIRIGLRAKVNDSLITGLRIVDSLLPVGRGQRQLILGDRYTGRSSVVHSIALASHTNNVESFGSKTLFNYMCKINQSFSKLSIEMEQLRAVLYCTVVLATQSSSNSLISFFLPLIGITMSERLRDRGFDVCLSFDDLSKHSKAYRQICLLNNRLPSRDAFASDIFQIHSSLLERISISDKLRCNLYQNGSITCFPLIETVSEDISEYIATNIISITDGQFYMNKGLFKIGIRPAIDSSLSVTRIGSNAQCKWMKLVSAGIKNELTTKRNNSSLSNNNEGNNLDWRQLICLNHIFFQNHLLISEIETSLILLLSYYCNNIVFMKAFDIHRLLLILSMDYFYFYYIVFLSKSYYSIQLHFLLCYLLNRIINSTIN